MQSSKQGRRYKGYFFGNERDHTGALPLGLKRGQRGGGGYIFCKTSTDQPKQNPFDFFLILLSGNSRFPLSRLFKILNQIDQFTGK